VRDAAELKEHVFLETIDWTALSLKQVTPPFKPVVESDESTANFDSEFTSADIREIGLAGMDLDEEDPSEDWVSQSITGSGFIHTPNGPLGSDNPREAKLSPRGPLSPVLYSSPMTYNGNGPLGSAGRPLGIQIKSMKKKDPLESPLTNSVQEKFRGFTYSGGESMIAPPGVMKKALLSDEVAVDDEEVSEVTTEDEFDDTEKSAGRYANARRKGVTFSMLDDDETHV
jgi:hypothetical protein